jgi:hypothetical protein
LAVVGAIRLRRAGVVHLLHPVMVVKVKVKVVTTAVARSLVEEVLMRFREAALVAARYVRFSTRFALLGR